MTERAQRDSRVSLPHAFAVWRRNFDVFRRLWTWLLMPNLVDVSLSMLALGIGLGTKIGGFGGSHGYAEWIAPGLVMSSALFSAGFECSYGTYYRMDNQRTFDAMVATPVQLDDVILGEVFYGAFRGMASCALVAGVFGAFGLFHSWWALVLPLVGALAAWMMSALAVTATALSPMLESLGWWVSFGIFPMYWLSGTFYRPGQLPASLERAQLASPAFHAVNLGRAVAATPGVHWSWLCLVNVVVLTLAALIFTRTGIALMRRRLIR